MSSSPSSIHDFSKTKVLVIGDIMIDQYWFGDVNRISPEAPVPVVDLKSTESRLGGAANVALNLLAMGARVTLIGMVGKDSFGEEALQQQKQAGIACQYILSSEDRRTTVKSRIMAHGQNLLRIDQEDNQDMNEREWNQCQQLFDRCCGTEIPDIIILQDYNKGVLTNFSIPYFIQRAKEMGIPVMVDPKKQNFWAYKHCTVFKPNLKEVREALGEKNIPLAELHASLLTTLEHEYSFITLGAEGIFAGDANHAEVFPTIKRNIVDVCGAGDTVLSIISLYWSKNVKSDIIARLANIAGGQVCGWAGVVPINRDQFLQEVEELRIFEK